MNSNDAFKDKDPPWIAFESGKRSWDDFSHREQEQIVRHYAPKIRYLALRMKARLPGSVELNELISSGTLGLIESLGKFRPEMGIRFQTYSESRIRGAMLDELRRLDWFPRSLRQRLRTLDDAIHTFEHDSGRQPTEEELSAVTGLGVEDIREGLEALNSQAWLPLDSIENAIGDDPSNGGKPYAETANKELLECVAKLIDQLTPREKLVLSLYYAEGMNMRECADIIGITEGRVSQLHSQALLRLRRMLTEQENTAPGARRSAKRR